MKISIITPALKHGGSERVICILANQWVDMGHNVRIIVAGADSKCVYELNSKVDIYSFGGLKGIRGLSHLNFIHQLRVGIKEFESDVVVSFVRDTTFYTGMALIGTGIPLIYSEISDPNIYMRNPKHKFFTLMSAFFAKGIVFQTSGAQACYNKKTRNKSVVIINPFDATNLPKYIFENRNKEIVTTGRLVPSKRHDLMIEAFSKLSSEFSDYVFKIYGDGTLKEQLENQIEQQGLKDKIFIMGAHSDIISKISNAAMFVFASDYEGMPNVVIEAQATGLPCIIADTITKEADITGLVKYLPISDIGVWADEIEKSVKDDRIDTKSFFVKNGYDIRCEAQKFTDMVFEEL